MQKRLTSHRPTMDEDVVPFVIRKGKHGRRKHPADHRQEKITHKK